MALLTGLLHSLLAVLVLSGLDKLWRPTGAARALFASRLVGETVSGIVARLLGLFELSAALLTLYLTFAYPARLTALAVAGLAGVFGGFVWFTRRLNRLDPDAGCGCFGATEQPPGPWHERFNLAAVLALAAVALVVLITGQPPLADSLRDAGPGVWLAHLIAVTTAASLFLSGPALLAATDSGPAAGSDLEFSITGKLSR